MLDIFSTKSSTIYLLFCLIFWNIMLHVHFSCINFIPPVGMTFFCGFLLVLGVRTLTTTILSYKLQLYTTSYANSPISCGTT